MKRNLLEELTEGIEFLQEKRIVNYKGMEDLQSKLIEKGYSLYSNHLTGEYNLCNWVACKRAPNHTRQCDCNEKNVQFVITPHHMAFNNIESKSVAVDITAE